MKKLILIVTVCCASILVTKNANAQRYLSEIFSSVNVTTNVQYGTNFAINFSPPPPLISIPLMMDIYQPAGDVATNRALLIFMHTGSYLPRYINGQPIGSRNDSATVEMCNRFARRGYVCVNMDYRIGWNPAGSNVDIRRGTLLQAVYRSIQDCKACVRYCRANYSTYGIDTTKVIIGGHGTGGYIALNYACLYDPAQITLPKFISGITDLTYGFVQGQPYISQAVFGDYDGYNGNPAINNNNNTPGHDNSVQFVFNMGGDVGDSSWLVAGQAPMVAFHVLGDPFAPFGDGIVYVPTSPPQAVVDVSGSGHIIPLADALGNNNCFINAGFTDPFTLSANAINNGLGLGTVEGLYPFVTNPLVQSGPWEWYDSLTVVNGAAAVGQNGSQIYSNALLTNPDMSKAKATAYIDTVMGYLNPRIVYCLGLSTGINDVKQNANVHLYPNPAQKFVTVTSTQPIRKIEVINIGGQTVSSFENINSAEFKFNKTGMDKGMYFVRISFDSGTVSEKLVLQ